MIKAINLIAVLFLSYVLVGTLEANNEVPIGLVIIYVISVITMFIQFRIEEVKYATGKNLRK